MNDERNQRPNAKPVFHHPIAHKGKVPNMREVLKTASTMFPCRFTRIDVGLRCDDLGEWVSCVTQWKPGADLEDYQELKTTLSEARKGRADVLCDLYCYTTSNGQDELETNMTLRLRDWSLTLSHYSKFWNPCGDTNTEMVGGIAVDFGTASWDEIRTASVEAGHLPAAEILSVITEGEAVTTRFADRIVCDNNLSVVDDALDAVREGNANTTPAELGASLLSAHARGDHVRKSAKRSAELSTEQIKLGMSVFGSNQGDNNAR